MVAYTSILDSNAAFSQDSANPELVAVFAGATSGIGQATLKTFLRYAKRPRIYIFARSQTSAARLIDECGVLNPTASLIPVIADLASMRETEKACKIVLAKETRINLLFHSAGELSLDRSLTPEGLHTLLACAIYSKMLIISRLLSCLEAAGTAGSSSLARVVIVGTGGKEGQIDLNDLAALQIPLTKLRGHVASLMTLCLEQLAQKAPHVTFIHNFSGSVRTALFDKVGGVLRIVRPVFFAMSYVGEMLGWPEFLRIEEAAERHVFLLTSPIYPPRHHRDQPSVDSSNMQSQTTQIFGTDGEVGSGTYSVDYLCESAPERVLSLLRKYREEGIDAVVWTSTHQQIERILT